MAFSLQGYKIARVLKCYGTKLSIGGREIRGIFQAVNGKNWQNLEAKASALGEISRGQYLYLGPPEADVREGEVLKLGKKEYRFRRVEDYYFRDTVLYQWGICVEKGVNDTWES